jgi:hypothetical protein
MTLRDDVLPLVNMGRQIVDDLGLRTTTVALRTRTWSSGVVGRGTTTDVDVEITPRPKVERRGDLDLLVGPITPAFSLGGYTVEQLNGVDTAGVERLFVVTGPSNVNRLYVLHRIEAEEPFRYMLWLSLFDHTARLG